uniref:Lipase_3 domain-containing protein n=1 Tax=Parastrongyloides trichosuri TaxID=131310 RepID=A0A0N4ZHV8_PARTI
MHLLVLFFIPFCFGYNFNFTTNFVQEEAEIVEAAAVYVPISKYRTSNLCEKLNPKKCFCKHEVYLKKAGEDGFNIVAYHASQKEILYVVFSYDKNPDKLLKEYMKFDATKVMFHDAPGVFKHQIDILNKGETYINNTLYKICLSGEYKYIVFAGHSVAGGVASLMAYECIYKGFCDKNKTKVYTFGSPRTGNCHFAKKYDEMVPYTYRVVVKGDPLTAVPQRHCKKGYKKCNECTAKNLNYHHHFGQEIYYEKNVTGVPRHCKKFTEDRKCNLIRVPSSQRRKQIEDAYAQHFYKKYYRNSFENLFILYGDCPFKDKN